MAAKTKTQKINMSNLESILEDIFVKKAPALPKNLKEAIVNCGPWLILVSLVFSLPAILAIFGLGAISMPFSYLGGIRSGYNFSLNFIFTYAIIILNAVALPGLFKRTRQGWKFLFYSSLVAFVQNLLTFNLGSLVVGSAISWYFLFQIKSYFKK